jgi:WhiB family redox-sensing transcriptional regulator
MYAVDINYIHEEESQAGALELVVTPVDPWAKARCRDGHGTLTHLFFSDEVLEIARAKAICAKCPLQSQCLDAALERLEPWGVWGGQLIANGRVVVHKRPRGRPPKHPRPELVVDEVPIPPHLVA